MDHLPDSLSRTTQIPGRNGHVSHMAMRRTPLFCSVAGGRLKRDSCETKSGGVSPLFEGPVLGVPLPRFYGGPIAGGGLWHKWIACLVDDGATRAGFGLRPNEERTGGRVLHRVELPLTLLSKA
jgi:hypothetical protein